MSGSAVTPTDLSSADLSDPCQVAAALRRAYFRLVGGEQETRIKFWNGDVEEEVTFAPPNLGALSAELARQESLCAAKTNGPGGGQNRPARFCATAG